MELYIKRNRNDRTDQLGSLIWNGDYWREKNEGHARCWLAHLDIELYLLLKSINVCSIGSIELMWLSWNRINQRLFIVLNSFLSNCFVWLITLIFEIMCQSTLFASPFIRTANTWASRFDIAQIEQRTSIANLIEFHPSAHQSDH